MTGQRISMPSRRSCCLEAVRCASFSCTWCGLQPFVEAVGGQHAGRFADVPFDRVQAVAAVGDVGGADVLAGRQ